MLSEPTPPAFEGGVCFGPLVIQMRMPNESERISEQWPPFADAFREIHRFILKAMDGDAAAANGLFQNYLKAAGGLAPNFAELGAGGASMPFEEVGRSEYWGC